MTIPRGSDFPGKQPLCGAHPPVRRKIDLWLRAWRPWVIGPDISSRFWKGGAKQAAKKPVQAVILSIDSHGAAHDKQKLDWEQRASNLSS